MAIPTTLGQRPRPAGDDRVCPASEAACGPGGGVGGNEQEAPHQGCVLTVRSTPIIDERVYFSFSHLIDLSDTSWTPPPSATSNRPLQTNIPRVKKDGSAELPLRTVRERFVHQISMEECVSSLRRTAVVASRCAIHLPYSLFFDVRRPAAARTS